MRRVTRPDEIERAQEGLQRNLLASATRSGPLSLGWKGGGKQVTVAWLERDAFWVGFNDIERRFWNAFGLGNPFESSQAKVIVVEINPAKSGDDRRCAGAFLSADDGRTFLAHSGRVGGGRKGIGRDAFLDGYQGERARVGDELWLRVGELDTPELPSRIAAFVRAVDGFKRRVVGDTEVAT